MPLVLPTDLPAYSTLQDENIFVMRPGRASTQDIRPLEILVVNLMPNKIITETQLARVLANSPLQVRLTLLRTGSYQPTNTSADHLAAFYTTLDQVQEHRYDGMIITGAPIEHLDFEAVEYWPELRTLFDYARQNVYSTVYLCWGALAGLYYYYGIPKEMYETKLHGVFSHRVTRPNNPLVRGFDEVFYVPHSRSAGVRKEDVDNVPALRILADSKDAGVHLLSTENGREIYILGHMEYDKETLKDEYLRDEKRGLNPPLPENYFMDDDPNGDIIFNWRSHGHLLYSNWLNYYVYQNTPFDLQQLEERK